MKVFNATITARYGMTNLVRNVLVIAEDKAAAMQRLDRYILEDRKLSRSKIKDIIATEEVAIE